MHSEYKIKEVPGYNGIYGCDKLGNVWSKNRSGPGIDINIEWKKLKPNRLKNGYLRVTLFKNKIRYYCLVHRIVVLTFIGNIPNNMEVAHNNGKRDDNRLENLRVTTHIDNQMDQISHGTVVNGTRIWTSKINENDVINIRNRHKNGESCYRIAKDYNVTKQNILSIVKYKTWKHIK